MKTLILAATAAGIFAGTPAFADYYIVKDGPSCKVVSQKPTDTKIVVMGDGKVFKTEKEAQEQVKVVCK
jgi:hypothetical protein